MKSFAAITISLIGLSLGLSTVNATAQAQKANGSCWNWTASGKNGQVETASCQSQEGNEHLELVFSKHEFSYMVIRVAAPLPIKDPSKGWLRQVGQNKVQINIVFGNEPPVSEVWGAAQQSDNPLPLLCPMNLSSKPFAKALRSDRMKVSYTNADGKSVNAVFDLSGMREQIKEHHEKVGNFGISDVLKGVAAF